MPSDPSDWGEIRSIVTQPLSASERVALARKIIDAQVEAPQALAMERYVQAMVHERPLRQRWYFEEPMPYFTVSVCNLEILHARKIRADLYFFFGVDLPAMYGDPPVALRLTLEDPWGTEHRLSHIRADRSVSQIHMSALLTQSFDHPTPVPPRGFWSMDIEPYDIRPSTTAEVIFEVLQ